MCRSPVAHFQGSTNGDRLTRGVAPGCLVSPLRGLVDRRTIWKRRLVDPFDANLVATLKAVFALVVPETVLVVAACAIFLGGTVRAGRGLWGTAALISIAA